MQRVIRSRILAASTLVVASVLPSCGSDNSRLGTVRSGDGGAAATPGDGAVAGSSGAPASGGAAGSAGAAGVSGAAGAGVAGVAGAGGTTSNTDAGVIDAGEAGETGVADAGDAAPRIPDVPAQCPTLATGSVTILGQVIELWVGPSDRRGPLVFYWHATGSPTTEAVTGLASGVNEVTDQGGVVAAFTTSTGNGDLVGNGMWSTGDFAMADVVVACAVQQGLVDPRRIYTAGCSAGALMASWMVYARSSYLAAAMVNSGGIYQDHELEVAGYTPAVITTFGYQNDLWLVDFRRTSERLTKDVASRGGFAANCEHDSGLCGSPPGVKAAQWQFLKDHPFGVRPSPYAAGLPPSFPAGCTIVR